MKNTHFFIKKWIYSQQTRSFHGCRVDFYTSDDLRNCLKGLDTEYRRIWHPPLFKAAKIWIVYIYIYVYIYLSITTSHWKYIGLPDK